MSDPLVSPGGGSTERETVRLTARAHDADRYLAALLAPRDVRDNLIALAAFAGETARIPHLVTEPTMGEIRLQWWRDALHQIDSGAETGNPVADALGRAMRRHTLPAGLLTGVTEARAFDLYPDPMPDETAFRAYLAKTEGALINLALRIVSASTAGALGQVAAAAGQAIGLSRVMAGLPQALSNGRCALPVTQLEAVGVTAAALADVPLTDAARDVLASYRAQARAAVRRVAQQWPKLTRRERAALLPVALVEPQLRALEGPVLHPGRDVAVVHPLTRVWRLWRVHVGGRL